KICIKSVIKTFVSFFVYVHFFINWCTTHQRNTCRCQNYILVKQFHFIYRAFNFIIKGTSLSIFFSSPYVPYAKEDGTKRVTSSPSWIKRKAFSTAFNSSKCPNLASLLSMD